MKRLLCAVAMIFACITSALSAAPAPLATLAAVNALSNAEARHQLPVAFKAVVTYVRAYENVLFVQDGDAALFVAVTTDQKFVPGDRVLVRGTTHESFRPYVRSEDVTLLGHGLPPNPSTPSFGQMIRGETDCRRVKIHALIQAADLSPSATFLRTTTYLQMLVDGGHADATVDSDDPGSLNGLLDAEVEITGVVSGQFDNKMQQTGVLFHLQSLSDVKILKRADYDPWKLGTTSMNRIITGYDVKDLTRRVRVEGTITYYQPGTAVVLQEGGNSLWAAIQSSSPLRVGDRAEATGFPDVQNGFLTLTRSEVRDSSTRAPILPSLFTWRELALGGNAGGSHLFDLVSIEGRVVTEVRQATQDEYVLETDGHLFSAILRHPGSVSRVPLAPMEQIPIGARIRVTGICMLEDANPFNGDVPFHILMRSLDDIAVVARPPFLNVEHLIVLVALLLLAVLAIGGRGWYIERKMRRQTDGLAQFEQHRSHILEEMNASRALPDIFAQITKLVSFRLDGAPCWCEVGDDLSVGSRPPAESGLSIVECAVMARNGSVLGKIYAAITESTQTPENALKALSMAAELAALAVETSRLHSDLVHRSEFDLLTDIQNRFSMERCLEEMLRTAQGCGGGFGLIYIDLNDFKQVNDRYGHQVGDFFLQEVAARMKRQVRPGDMLARLGGDEFAVLVRDVRERGKAEEIARRLNHCFEQLFSIEDNLIRGSASIGYALYPTDATTKDGLLNVADAAMYKAKHSRQHFDQATGTNS